MRLKEPGLMINLRKLTQREQRTLLILNCALADLEGIMPEFDPCEDHSAWDTINDIKIEIAYLSGNWKELWNELENICIMNEETDQKFLHFPPGTDIHEIWYWFEETFDICVGDVIKGK